MKIPVSKAYAKWMDEDAARLNAMAELARKVAVTLPSKKEAEKRAFCPTGPGGGIDNSCSAVSASDPSLKERVPFTPIGDGKNSDFIRVPSVDELTEALTGSNSSKGTKIGSAKDIQAGTPVALRIDIPAFNYSTKNMGKAIYAVTIHENKGGKSFGSPLAYEPMARLTGPVTFAAKEKEATKVATGEASKFPLATVKGNFDPSRTMPPDIDSWTPVGYDPKKASYFYDKKTGREVMGGTDALSVGNSVFVRVPKYGYRNAKETYRDAGFWGVEFRADDCGRDADGKFGSGNKCAGDEGSPSATREKPSWMKGKVDASGTTSHGDWFLERNEDGNESPGHGDVTSHIVRLVDGSSRVKAFVYADVHDDDMYINYAHVDEPHRGQGVYKSLLDSLSEKYRVTSDSEVATPVRKAYEALGASLSRDGRYVLERKRKGESRSADCGRQEGGKFGPGNKCQEDGDGGTATPPSPSTPTSTKMPTARVGDPANGTAWLSPSGVFHPVPRVKPPALRLKSPSGFTTHDEWASLHGHEDGEDGLLKAGWARVAKIGNEAYVQTIGNPLTSRQKKSLEDQAIIAGYDSIDHDMAPSMADRGGPGTKHKTIWSKSDRSWTDESEERAYCPTGEGNGQDNSCSSAGPGSGLTNLGGKVESWGGSNETEIWTPDRPMFRGADKIGEIMINRPADVRSIAGDTLQLTMPEIVTASGALIDAIERAGTSRARMTITPAQFGSFNDGIYVSWKVVGRATGEGYSGADSAFKPRPGTIVNAVEASRTIARDSEGKTHLYQDAYFIHPDYQGRGLALESVIRQTSVPGIETISMGAARWDHQNPNQRMNGYWRWPLYGYNASIPTIIRDSKSGRIPDEFSKARSLLDIYAMPGGKEWWKEEGEDVTLMFDTRPRSQSRLVLLQLQDVVRRKHGSRSIDMAGDDKNLMSTDCDNDPDVEAAWEEIIKKGLKQEAPGRIEQLEASAEKSLQEIAKDGRPPEVRPH